MLKFLYSITLLSVLLVPSFLPANASTDTNKIQTMNLLQTPVARSVYLENILLDGQNTAVSLELERFEVFAPDVQIVVRDGRGNEQIHPRPTTAYFKGEIIGDPSSLVVLSVDPAGTMHGIAQQDDKLWILANDTVTENNHSTLISQEVKQTGGLDGLPPFNCGVEGRMLELTPPAQPHLNILPAAPLPAGQFYQVPVAIETDGEFYALFGSSSAATSYIGNLFAYASVIYNREASAQLMVGYVSLWSDAGSDPWNHTSTSQGLFSFRDYWNANRTATSRAIAHFLSGRSLGGGIAYLGVLCNSSFGYGYSASIEGTFQIGNPQSVWDIIVVTHEIGHNFSSPHTHCYGGIGGNGNPVDACWGTETGTGCWSGSTSLPGINSVTGGTAGGGNGTIMSYCHQRSGGYNNITLTFGQNHIYGVAANRVSTKIADYVASVATAYPNCISIASTPSYLLAITKVGTGTGTVASSPAGIACGDTCQATFPAGATVTLTGTATAPTPYAPGSFLAGWSGCHQPGWRCEVQIDQVTPVTATFTRINMGGFGDVPVGYWADDAIYALRDAGITTGCGGGNYCPSNAVTRAQMAVFLERGVHGAGYVPPAAVGLFADVSPGYWAAAWIEALYADGVTGGCAASPLRYCPEDAVTRAQMAVFLLRAKHGQTYAPPAATGTVFGDVPSSYWAAAWIEQLAREGITAGCGGGNYCPDSPVARDQMAVFLGRTFLGMP